MFGPASRSVLAALGAAALVLTGATAATSAPVSGRHAATATQTARPSHRDKLWLARAVLAAATRTTSDDRVAVVRPARPSAAGLNYTWLSSTHFYGQVRVTPTNQVYWYDLDPR